jgi:DNA-binding transcriptional regulator YdaS (Cro superfamily)
MRLEEFLKINKMTTSDFSTRISCGQPMVSNLCNRRRRPSPALALRIERATGGAVSRDEMLFPELYPSNMDDIKRTKLTK